MTEQVVRQFSSLYLPLVGRSDDAFGGVGVGASAG
jgi:hypothetical protein